MGMFDTIRCELPLPGLGDKNTEFQTKSFMCTLENITIQRNGTVVMTCKKCAEPIYLHIHEPIIFYTVMDGNWIEYVALVKNGHVTEIVNTYK